MSLPQIKKLPHPVTEHDEHSSFNQAGAANAPKLGDPREWAPRIKQGMDTLVQSVLKGKGAMPPKAGSPTLSDAEIRAAIELMVSQSK